MNVSEQLLDIARKTPAVANKVKEYLSSASNVGALTFNDVSPIEHEMLVRVEGEPGVTLTRCGKNLFNKNKTEWLLNGYVSSSGAYMSSSGGEKSFMFKCQPNTNYVVRKVYAPTNRVGGFSTIPNSGTTGKLLGEFNNTDTYTFNSGNAEYIIVWYFNNHGESVTNDDMLNSIQLEYGTIATDYEPYMGVDYTLDKDGSVHGVTSLSPVTTLISDTNDAIITAKYFNANASEQVITGYDTLSQTLNALLDKE